MVFRKKTIYVTCPYCGAHLDHGEICDCRKKNTDERREESRTKAGAAYGVSQTPMLYRKRKGEWA